MAENSKTAGNKTAADQKPGAVDYPVVACCFCTSKNTIRLPERSAAAVKDGWWHRQCRDCGRKFKAAQ